MCIYREIYKILKLMYRVAMFPVCVCVYIYCILTLILDCHCTDESIDEGGSYVVCIQIPFFVKYWSY